MNNKETIYVSDLLEQDYKPFYDQLKSALNDHDIEVKLVTGTQDIWVRDFMPVKSSDGKYILFNYDPYYFEPHWKDKKTPRENIIRFLKENNIEYKSGEDIKLDGGNVICKKDKFIITDIIFKENGCQKDKVKQNELINKISAQLGGKVIIIPHQPGDVLGHADGMVRFFNYDTVIVNNFSSALKIIESKSFYDSFFGALGKVGLNIIQIPYAPVDEKGKDNMPVAYGFYINFLETEKCIFLPQFGEGFEKKDFEALEFFKNLYLKRNKEVIPVNSREIAWGGGVLNCITWN